MDNDELYDNALEAINEVFSDCSVDKSVCKSNLESLRDEIGTLLESLE